MMNVKISEKHDNMYHIRKNHTLKFIYDDKNECINDTLSWIKHCSDREDWLSIYL